MEPGIHGGRDLFSLLRELLLMRATNVFKEGCGRFCTAQPTRPQRCGAGTFRDWEWAVLTAAGVSSVLLGSFHKMAMFETESSHLAKTGVCSDEYWGSNLCSCSMSVGSSCQCYLFCWSVWERDTALTLTFSCYLYSHFPPVVSLHSFLLNNHLLHPFQSNRMHILLHVKNPK